MRHLFIGIPVLLFSAGLVACNGNGQPLESDWVTPTPNATTAPNPTPTPTTNPAPTPTPTVSPSPIPTGSALYMGPAEVEQYVVKFVSDGQAQGVDVLPNMKNPTLTIQIADLSQYGSSVIGLCESGGNQRRVTFSPSFWNSVNDTQRELLAHHELGHCVLNRPHRNDLLDSGAYASIMYPIIMASATYQNNYAYYQNELFHYQDAQSAASSANSNIFICNQDEIGL